MRLKSVDEAAAEPMDGLFVRACYNGDMENILSRNVTEIPEANRRSLEDLLGRQLHEHQQVFIMVLDASLAPDVVQRAAAAAGLREIIAEAEAHADRVGASDAEIDAAVEAAMTHARQRQAS